MLPLLDPVSILCPCQGERRKATNGITHVDRKVKPIMVVHCWCKVGHTLELYTRSFVVKAKPSSHPVFMPQPELGIETERNALPPDRRLSAVYSTWRGTRRLSVVRSRITKTVTAAGSR